MLNCFTTPRGRTWMWTLILALGIAMEAVALFFQYQLDYGPCVLCVHIRAWVFAIILVALVGLFSKSCQIAQRFSSVLFLSTAIGLLERAYVTFGVERGFIDGACTLDSGFPDWLPLDRWSATIFKPWEACGYTPELLFGITMAEGLVALAVLLVIAAFLLLVGSFKKE